MQESLALVLSGGSVRAAAHVGVLQALEEFDLQPDLVVGSSGGAIIAALYASGMAVQDIKTLFLEYTTRKSDLVDLNWPGFIVGLLTLDITKVPGVVRGNALERLIEMNLVKAKQFTQLTNVQLLIPTVNLNTGQQTVFCDFNRLKIPEKGGEYANFQLRDHLTIAQAVRASISIPGVFVPASFLGDTPGDCYVDGGVRNGYPLSVAVKLGRARQIIGVNLGYAGMRREDVLASGPFEILSQSLDIMMRGQYRDILNDSDVRRSKIMTINPLIYDIGTFDVEYIPEMIERGYDVAARMLEEKGLQPSVRAQNRTVLFNKIRGAETFPRQGTPYFEQLLKNQIKQKPPRIKPQHHNVLKRAYRSIRNLLGFKSKPKAQTKTKAKGKLGS